TNAQWDFFCQLAFNTSGANYTDIFLTASASDLTQAATTGYFVRIGNADDEISLYRKDATGIVKIIDGANGITNSSNTVLNIRVIRDTNNLWTLSRDITGTSTSFFIEGTVIDQTYLTSSFFGILVRQSSAGFFQRHFFDDISLVDFTPDITPPMLQSVTAITATTADVLFNEPVSLASSQIISNYVVNNNIGNPMLAQRDASNTALVHLTFANSFPNNTPLQLTVNGVTDIVGNAISNGIGSFIYFTAIQYDVLITEIMADPTPLVALPDAEWIELRNTSRFDINLQGWRIGKPTGQTGPMPSYNLRADSFVIVSTGSAVTVLSQYGPTISVTSFPGLNNTGDLLYLRSPQGTLIHSVNYTDAWYQNELKKAGGWSLEMQDTNNPCSGISNWKASTHPSGGTPGKLNAVNGNNSDNNGPSLLRAYATD
ncbi:MAG: lamin tail domain-containing protein, partial [Ferruginibacter sp.]